MQKLSGADDQQRRPMWTEENAIWKCTAYGNLADAKHTEHGHMGPSRSDTTNTHIAPKRTPRIQIGTSQKTTSNPHRRTRQAYRTQKTEEMPKPHRRRFIASLTRTLRQTCKQHRRRREAYRFCTIRRGQAPTSPHPCGGSCEVVHWCVRKHI